MLKPHRIVTLIAESVQCGIELVRHRKPGASEDTIKARAAICAVCDQSEGWRCKACGCLCDGSGTLMDKLAYNAATCPLGKWGKG